MAKTKEVMTVAQVAKAELSQDQLEIAGEVVHEIVVMGTARDDFAANMMGFVIAMFPTPAPHVAWKAMVAYIGDLYVKAGGASAEYAKNCLREAYKAQYGVLPSKGDSRATGAPKVSAKRTVKSVGTLLAEIADKLATLDGIVNAKRLARIASNLAALQRDIAAEQIDQAA